MYSSCLVKQDAFKKLFNTGTRETKYHTIIELGKSLPPFLPEEQIEDNRVLGCQSQMYLSSTYTDGLVHFKAHSDALISAGLAALLLSIYDMEAPETILKCPPTILQELGIPSIVSPSRANGLLSLYTKMQQFALKYLVA
ncbi:MAG: SufE family protein [Chlamydiia bacterium]|nr:SufE family protein [Chlamydiia bacterium]